MSGILVSVGCWASVIGVVVAIAGFAITIVNVRRSRSAATQARDAAQDAYASIRTVDALSELPAAISRMEEVRRLHRNNEWEGALAAYPGIRKTLVTVRAALHDLHKDEKEVLQQAVMAIRNMEVTVERQWHGTEKPKADRMNEELGDTIEALQVLLVTLKQRAGGNE